MKKNILLNDKLNSILSAATTSQLAYESMTLEKIQTLFNADYSEGSRFLFDGDFSAICRGMHDVGEMTLASPKNRVSENTTNIYTMLFSEILPSWKKYPKRNHCFVCTNSIRVAKGYGNRIYFVIPKNDTMVGICPKNDIWSSFEESGIAILRYLNDVMSGMFRIAFDTSIDTIAMYGTKKEMVDCLKLVNSNSINKIRDSFSAPYADWFWSMLDKMEAQPKLTFINCLDDLLNPEKNGFKLMPLKEYSTNTEYIDNEHEVWFDSSALFIKDSFYEKYIK